MFVSGVTRVAQLLKRLFLGVRRWLITQILTDIALLFMLTFIVTTILLEFTNNGELAQNTYKVIGQVILSFILVIIIIWGINTLYKRASVNTLVTAKVSQLKEGLLKLLQILFALLLGLYLSLRVVNSEYELEKSTKTFWSSFTNNEAKVKVLIDREPEPDHTKWNITGSILSGNKTNLLFSLPKYPVVHLGQVCLLEGEILEPKSYEDFDYKKYLERKMVYRIMRVKRSECKESANLSWWLKIKKVLVDLKTEFVSIIDRNMPEPQSSLLDGIVFGQDRVFSDEFDSAVKNAGVSHVVAASGYNISFVVGIIGSLFAFINRRKRTLFEIFGVWGYCIMSGLSTSIVRAGLMYTLARGISFLGIYVPIFHIMVLSLFVSMVINPRIIFDVGFQLSYLATIGLVYILPYLERLTKLVGLKSFSGSIFLPTLACTIATLLITALTFGKVQILSIVVNTIVLPVIDSVLVLGVAAIGLYLVLPELSRPIFLVIWTQLKFFEIVVRFFGNISWSVVNI